MVSHPGVGGLERAVQFHRDHNTPAIVELIMLNICAQCATTIRVVQQPGNEGVLVGDHEPCNGKVFMLISLLRSEPYEG
jgi:hypothetical protein